MALLSEIGEFGLIERLRALDLVSGIGDDCAVLTPPAGHDLVVTTDALVEDVHFRMDWYDWEAVGWKSAAVNLSDLAAMGARPAGMVISLGFRKDTEVEDALAFYDGIDSLLEDNDIECPVMGGDIVASPQAVMVNVTAFGFVPSGTALTRSGAKPGDEIWVTDTLGEAAAGLRVLQTIGYPEDFSYMGTILRQKIPTPRVAEGIAARESGLVHAMIDVSDGLAGDLGHILDESGVGALIAESDIPLSRDLVDTARAFGWDPMDLALHGGEDYELLFAAAPNQATALKKVFRRYGMPVTRIGKVTDTPGLRIRRSTGKVEPLEPKAFHHF